jgi:hypothetical protein
MIRLIKIPENEFNMSEIMGNIFHFTILDKFHIKVTKYQGGWNMAFSFINMYEFEYINYNKRPDLIPLINDRNWYKVLFSIGDKVKVKDSSTNKLLILKI